MNVADGFLARIGMITADVLVGLSLMIIVPVALFAVAYAVALAQNAKISIKRFLKKRKDDHDKKAGLQDQGPGSKEA